MINRRSFIAALSTSVAAAGTAESAESEHSALIALSDRLPSALNAYQEAASDVEWINAEWEPQWPMPDPEIYLYGFDTKRHEGLLGQGIETPWGKGEETRIQNIGTPERFEAEYQDHMERADRKAGYKSPKAMQRELRWAERAKARKEIARSYWAEVDRVKSASGIEAAQKRKAQALEALSNLIGEIMEFDEKTLAGLAVKAQALTAWQEVPKSWQIMNHDAPKWLSGMASSINRLVT